MHRVRTSLPFFREHGYEPLILALDPRSTSLQQDPELKLTLPPDLRIWRVSPLPLQATRWFGLRNDALRSAQSFLKAGNDIIRSQHVELIYFSTTMFPLLALGPYWQKRFGIPFIVDLQDPWYTDYYSRKDASPPPGGRLKFAIANGFARLIEPFTLRRASHIVVVSPTYKDTLLRHYKDLAADRFTVLPFGAAELDFSILRQLAVRQDIFDPNDDRRHWVYIGRAGHDMQFALRAFFAALHVARSSNPAYFDKLRLHFVGTDYALGDRARKTVEPVARECGVADIVDERPHRISYFKALQCLTDADALIMPGSDDVGYTASKLYPYVLARKPLLAVFHENSTVVSILNATRAGVVVSFTSEEPVAAVRDRITAEWFQGAFTCQPQTNWAAFAPYTAREMAKRQFNVFDRCLGPRDTVAARS